MTGWNVLKCGTFKLDPCDNVRIDLNHCSRRFGGIFQCHWCLYSIAKIFWKFNIQIHLIKKGQIMLIKPKCNSINVVNKTYMKKGLMRILILTFPLNTTLQVERNYLTLQMFYMLPAMLLMTCNSTKTSGIMVYNMIYCWEHLIKPYLRRYQSIIEILELEIQIHFLPYANWSKVWKYVQSKSTLQHFHF